MSRLRSVLVLVVVAVCALAGVGVGNVAAVPTGPTISVFLSDGVTPVGDTVLHPGDEVVVKGVGFDPRANTSGLPVPVPPGVPHGTFVTFGGFAPVWQPSKGAPASSRAEVRSKTKWALSRNALAKVPNAPFDLRRTVRQQWVPLDAAGRFTARLTLATPDKVPAGKRWGVYTYGAADAVNASQERFVPINYSTDSGPNTPKAPAKDLVWGLSPAFASSVERSGGSLSGSDGSGVDDAGRMSFELTDNSIANGRGELRYRGTVVAFTKFHLLEIALADPIIRVNGTRAVLSMRTSSTDMNGTDALRRIDVADLHLTAAQASRIVRGLPVTGVRTTFRAGLTPTSLAAASLSGALPVALS
ncbi:HtaA domain-containing protein [Gordonia sp. PDNC005]|uniref:HtaA domain-containing protein n=1 Tax=unclassified Gordonia (in: high G+C Gram-positive bacteria) TaxID=2657482 RepID=UPI00196594E6|nr:HtaA domain-containing protein [Gordonia sp. PDNC005]QRY62078.1 HtaA domain-containing protein [Gordonia sp. PDNC005]